MNVAILLVSIASLSRSVLGQAPDEPPPSPAPPAYLQPTPPTAAAPAEPEQHLLPLWADKVRKAGFELPPAFGVMVNYYYQKSGVQLSNLKLGLNDGPLRDASFIQFGNSEAKASALAVRPSFMLFPFLTFYGLLSSGHSTTDVVLTSPVEFTTQAKSGAWVVALGTTLQVGYKGFFLVADFNASLADVDRIADLVGANLLSFRVGYNYRFGPLGRGIAFWLGTSGQVIGLDTNGNVKLADVLPSPSQDQVDKVNARCDALRPNDPRKQVCTDFANKLQSWVNGSEPAASVAYSLDKKPTDIWNMLVGAQFSLDRNWHFRVEVGFWGRISFLAGTEYRFDL
jgi:hypothetical protein